MGVAMRFGTGIRRVVAGAAALATAGALVACDSTQYAAQRSLSAFLADWHAGTLQKASYAKGSGAQVAGAYRTVVGDLAGLHPTLHAGEVTVDGARASAPVRVEWPLPGHTWRYTTTVRLAKSGDSWRIAWSGATVHPKLSGDGRLVLVSQQGPRASIMDGSGRPMVTERPVVYVGVQPNRVSDPDGLAKQLGDALDLDLSDLPKRISAADPVAFVDVVTLRKADYEKVRSKIYDLRGTVFRTGSLPLAPTRTFARGLLGTVGPVTKEMMDAHPGRYQIGDTAGQSGLQAQYEQRLAGSAGVTVTTSDTHRTLYRGRPSPGKPVATTLDPAVQRAADEALGTQTRHRTALVAIRVSTGTVLAVANGPDGGSDDLALTASVPPGSTFKVVTALSYLDAGVTPDSTVDCPRYATVQGRRFHNENTFQLGKVPFRTDFAQSCNTAFVGLSGKLGPDTLTRQAEKLGIGRDWRLGPDVNSGSVPAATTPVDRAAAAFGQGKTTVSPIAMAGISAAVARGHWTQPTLVTNPSYHPAADGPQLPKKNLSALRSMMRSVVTDGTGTVLKSVPGGPVYGKTGTAEYGSGAEPPSHSWFTGYQGDIAFAAFVEGGGTNESAVAAPLVAKFLTNLNG